MSKVAAVKTTPPTVIDDYSRLMDMADYRKTLSPQRETLLKINLSWSLYYPSCSTQPWQLEGVMRKLKQDGYPKLWPVENRTVVTDVWKGARGNKWLPILEQQGEKLTPLTDVKWINYQPKAQMLALDDIFKDGHKIPELFIGKDVIHLPTIKTHGHTTMTGAIKNAFGGLITSRRHHCHKKIHDVIVDLLSIQREIHPGIFAVMDGTVAGDGKGPRTMIPRQCDTLLASADQVAIDAISAKIMGFDPMKIRFLKLAHDKGLGCADPDQIEIIGDDVRSTNLGFRTGKSPVILFDQIFRKGALSFVEPMLFHTGLFKSCVFASAFYHDKLWYPTIGKHRIRKFNKTPWGKLFQTYR